MIISFALKKKYCSDDSTSTEGKKIWLTNTPLDRKCGRRGCFNLKIFSFSLLPRCNHFLVLLYETLVRSNQLYQYYFYPYKTEWVAWTPCL